MFEEDQEKTFGKWLCVQVANVCQEGDYDTQGGFITAVVSEQTSSSNIGKGNAEHQDENKPASQEL